MLKDSKEHWAIITRHRPITARSSAAGVFEYTISNETYSFQQSGDYTMLDIGDTVQIEYSVKDNNLAQVIDKYYYQK